MAPRKRQPEQKYRIEGRWRLVVYQCAKYWVERLDDGTHVIHPGKIVTAQVPSRELPEPKPCSVCKQPTTSATPRGRAVHDMCREGWCNVLPDDVAEQIEFGVAADLGAVFLPPLE